MISILPFEIFLSRKTAPAIWGMGLPKELTNYNLPFTDSYYLGIKQTGHVVAHQIPENHTQTWTNHFLTGDVPFNCFVKSKHKYIVFYYVIKGCVEYRHRTHYNVAISGNMNLLPSIDHELRIHEHSQLFLLYIPAEMLSGYRETFPNITEILYCSNETDLSALNAHNINDDGRIGRLVRQLYPTGKVTGQFGATLIEKILLAALDQLLPLPVEPCIRPQFTSAVKIVRSVMLEQLYDGRPSSLELLARKAGLSSRTLQTVFKQYCSKTMQEFYQNARMEAIYRGLHDRSRSLQEIADSFNYEDYSTFSAAIKRKWRMCPRELRNFVFNRPIKLE